MLALILMKAHLTWWLDVLNATYMIGKCISDINDPNTCKIEALLSQLNRKLQLEQTREFRNTRNTTIIVFF